MNRRLQEIHKKNAEFEKETPYNFCDRWCERCVHEKQIRCTLYKDELEQKITCIAHGKEPDDPEMTAEVMEKQYEALDKIMEEFEDGVDIDPNIEKDIEREEIQTEIRMLENIDLFQAAEQYHKKTHKFLEKTFYNKKVSKDHSYDFETLTWYHTLLLVKLRRALEGFYQPTSEDEFALYDAVAQFEICKKAIKLSVEAFRKIDKDLACFHQQILELIAFLHNIHSRIGAMEESI